MTPSMKPLVALTCAILTAAAPIATPALAQSYGASQTVAAGSGPRLINLPRGTSFAVDLPADARDVIVSNPAVAEANVHSPRRITVIGIAPGETDAVFLDAAGRSILTLRVRVDAGVSALQDTLSRVAPGSQVRAEAVNDSIILTGMVTSAAESERIAQVARAFVSAPEKVLNLTTIAASDQVTLRVRIVEVQRNAIKQLGLSSDVVFNNGLQSVGFGRDNTYSVNGSALGGSGACYNENRGIATDYNSTTTNGNTTTSSSSLGNTVTGVTTTETGTTITTLDGRRISFSSANPGSVTVTDFNGNTTTLTGTTITEPASFNLETISGTNAVNNFVNTVTSLLQTQSGNALSNVVENVVSSAYRAVTGTNASACLQAFERVGLVRTLAEPNLTSVNGESASFLAGGEYPVPTGRDRDGNVTIEFKPYGVSLAFRPVVLSEGRINLQISAEVSELTQTGGITLGAGTTGALAIAGLNVRRVQNTVEIPSGGSMMIAGLLQETSRQAIDSLPGLGGLPVLGQLFRSRDYLSGETELVVMVEPFIVNPTSPALMQTPADGLRIANDAQTIFFGQLNQAYGSPAPGASTAPAWSGPVGYVIE
ncbi:type II and III secretion system protein family protein [Brevundimonas bacteroides]|uniref:type II and III secretion system protein family protein n=1 Tax=Brevundimonas bacteroides TaxID=74311 RepID=UPI000ADC530C|nr:type II and III secretion system protein family protein [Brevundimonas bacteroides]